VVYAELRILFVEAKMEKYQNFIGGIFSLEF
jgi:hypothetical protein